MSQFLGTHQNRLDAKGRVSVPASFRAELKKLDAQGTLVLRPSHSHACIEVWPVPVFETLEKPLQELPDFSEEQIDLAATIYAGACRLEADKDGRVMLPDEMIAHANLGESVTFLGLGRMFQIWEPAAATAFQAAARERANARRLAKAVPA
jgi:MraZ protein